MNKSQKAFKVLKRKKYQEEIKEANIFATTQAFGIGVSAIIATCSMLDNTGSKKLNNLLKFTSVGINVFCLKGLTEQLLKKSILESKIEDINVELTMHSLENVEDLSDLGIKL